MTTLGYFLFGVAVVWWWSPRRLGQWLRSVADGFGPINININRNIYLQPKQGDEDAHS
ncbi:hypothetical protein [Ochrobactrum sp. CGA5]|uniref:hypothetical protein n=1 Tax=Ochrobactrum sp. CGA5 TaxID=2583453 RepID=UPI0015D59C5C|nr:hypothetical protein [Ochrobactrum sp. CGA5]